MARIREKRVSSAKWDSEDGIIPLINIVFLLLIFFMVAGQIQTPDPFAVTPPESESQVKRGEGDITLFVDADGRIALDAAEISVDAVQAMLVTRLAETPDARVWVKADAAAEAIAVFSVLDALRAAGAENARLLTVAKP